MIVVNSWAVVWLMWQFYCLAAAVQQDGKKTLEDLTSIIVAISILQTGWLVWDLFKAILASGVWAAGKAYSVEGAAPGNLGELACYAINGIDSAMFSHLKIVMTTIGFTQLGAAIWAIAMFLAVAALMVRILKHLSEPLVDVAMLFVLLPFMVMFSAISPFRGAALQSIKLMVNAMMELILISGIVGVMMAMMLNIGGQSPLQDGNLNISISSHWLGSPDYIVTLALVVFFYFSFDRAVQMPGRVFGMFTPRGINFSLPKF